MIAENVAETAKRVESKPLLSPTMVLSATANDVCELGIPPDDIKIRGENLFSRTILTTLLISCAASHDAAAVTSI